MQLKLFTVPIKNLTIPEAEMNAFLRAHRVLAGLIPEGPLADPVSVLPRQVRSVVVKCSARLPDVSSPSARFDRTLPATPFDLQNPVP